MIAKSAKKKNSKTNTEDTDRNTDKTEEALRKIRREKIQSENTILFS